MTKKHARRTDRHRSETASGGVSAAVTQLERKERPVRASVSRAGFLPFIITNADAGDPAWDTPAFMFGRQNGCVPGSSGPLVRSVLINHRSTQASSFPLAATRQSRREGRQGGCI